MTELRAMFFLHRFGIRQQVEFTIPLGYERTLNGGGSGAIGQEDVSGTSSMHAIC